MKVMPDVRDRPCSSLQLKVRFKSQTNDIASSDDDSDTDAAAAASAARMNVWYAKAIRNFVNISSSGDTEQHAEQSMSYLLLSCS
jgi:hypothetical protein